MASKAAGTARSAVRASRRSTTSFITSGTPTLASLAAIRQASAKATRHLYSSTYGSSEPMVRHSLPLNFCVGAASCAKREILFAQEEHNEPTDAIRIDDERQEDP